METQPPFALTFRFSLSAMVSNLYFSYFASGVEYAAPRKVCNAKLLLPVAVRRQIDGLFQLTKGSHFQRFLAGVLHVVTYVHRIFTAFSG